MWKFLGYVAADVAAGSTLPEALVTHPLWEMMVAPHWNGFLDLLHRAPDAQVRVPRAELDALAQDLADELDSWLRFLGFEFSDDADGGSGFWIRDPWLLGDGEEP